MTSFLEFIQNNGAGVGTLTLYTAGILFYFVLLPAEFQLANLVIFAAVAPAVIVYEITDEFTDLILGRLLEQHIAIARVKLELENEGDFEDWYSGENVEQIDDLDWNARQELTTLICALIIGVSAPFVGWFAIGFVGVFAGLVAFISSLLVILYSLKEIARTIERTPKVIQT